MIATRLEWPSKPYRTMDRNFGRRQTWRCRTDAYVVSRIPDYLPGEYLLTFPKWADQQPRRFRTLNAAMKYAQRHRNGEFDHD